MKAKFLRGWLGYGSYILAISLGFVGLHLLRQGRKEPPKVPWSRIYALELTAFIFIALMSLTSGASLESAEAGQGGGRIGWGLVELLRVIFQSIGLSSAIWLYLVFIVALLVILFYGSGLTGPLAAWLEKKGAAYAAEVDDIVENFLVGLSEKDYAIASRDFHEEFRDLWDEIAFRQMYDDVIGKTGVYQSKTLDHVENRGWRRVVIYHITFENNPDVLLEVYINTVFDPSIVGFEFFFDY